MKERWKELTGCWKGKLPLPAVLALMAGCCLLLLPTGGGVEQQEVPVSEEVFDLEAFEKKLEQVLSEIDGAGETKVVLSLEGGARRVLAQDRRQDGDSASAETVTVGSSSEEQVVPVQTVAPVFRGALVVCPGANNARVRLELTQAVCVLTGLGTDCVCVTTGVS